MRVLAFALFISTLNLIRIFSVFLGAFQARRT
jgi:hypothetical protein